MLRPSKRLSYVHSDGWRIENGGLPQTGQSAIKRAFSVCFFLFWCIFTLTICLNFSLFKNLAALALAGLLLLAGRAAAGPVDRMSPRAFRLLFALLLCAAFAGSFWMAYQMRIHLPTDTDIIFTSVADILRDGRLDEANPAIDASYFPGLALYTNNDYFCRYPNNIGLLMLYVGLYAVCKGFGFEAGTDAGQAPAIFLTALAVAATVFLLCRCARLLFQRNSCVLFTLLLCYAFLPFTFGISNFYTDLWVVFFAVAGVYCYLRAKQSGASSLLRLFTCGVLLAAGIQMKPTAAVVVVAICIDLALSASPPISRRAVQILTFLSGVLLFTIGFVLWYRTCGLFDFSRTDEIGAPWQLWFLIGSHAKGGLELHTDMRFAASFPTMAERSAAVWERAVQNYRAYSFPEFLLFLREKLLYAWGSGMFECDGYLLWPLESNWTVYLTQPQYHTTGMVHAYSEVYLLLIYFSNLLADGLALLRKKAEAVFLSNLSVFGLIIFLMLFENGARRVTLAVPFLILNVVFLMREASKGLCPKNAAKETESGDNNRENDRRPQS